MPQVSWYWNKNKWVQGHCMYYHELQKLGYYVKRGDVSMPPPPPTEQELMAHHEKQHESSNGQTNKS